MKNTFDHIFNVHELKNYVTCNIPELESDDGARVPVDDLECEVDADGSSVVLGEELVHIALNDGCLACAKLSDHQDLVQALSLVRLLTLQTNRLLFTSKT